MATIKYSRDFWESHGRLALSAALRSLSPAERQLLNLVDLHAQPIERAAYREGLSVRDAQAILTLARERAIQAIKVVQCRCAKAIDKETI